MVTSLAGKRFLVTGVSRPGGIGATVARRLAVRGAVVAAHGHPAYDVEQRYPDAGPGAADGVVDRSGVGGGSVVALRPSDLGRPGAAAAVVAEAAGAIGAVTDVVLNHAHSVGRPFGRWTEDDIDAHLAVNVRASMLLVQSYAEQFPGGTGAVTLMTSGQYLGPMVDEVAYAVSKEAVRNLTTHLAAILAPRGIRVNCVNPGPTDTGYLTGEAHEQVRRRFPGGRWGTPEDASRLIEFLHGDEGAWIIGQCIGSEGGFDRGPTAGRPAAEAPSTAPPEAGP